jgi:hypothetical protein
MGAYVGWGLVSILTVVLAGTGLGYFGFL